MGKKGGTKRGAEAVADASAKKGRRASEADVALRLGDELGEHTVVSLANIILLKIAADMEGDNRECFCLALQARLIVEIVQEFAEKHLPRCHYSRLRGH